MGRFGELLRKLRLRSGFGLRKFADLIDMAPSNLSAIENGRREPPVDELKLREIATALGLSEQSEEWSEFFDAARQPGHLPADIRHIADRQLVPVLLRTIENNQLSDEQIGALITDLNGSRVRHQ
jgi:transcriptional regulator with XRE-family HTH domain